MTNHIGHSPEMPSERPTTGSARANFGSLLIGQLTIRDHEAFARNSRAALPLLERFGGRVLAMSKVTPTVVEGTWRPSTLVVQGWPDDAAFEDFFRSPEYASIVPIRHSAAQSHLVLMQNLLS